MGYMDPLQPRRGRLYTLVKRSSSNSSSRRQRTFTVGRRISINVTIGASEA
jgi:hypothetical protein